MNVIEFRNVVKNYPEFCLGPINMAVRQGEFFGIFGPPSSGKTSILKLILGLLKPDDGEIFLSELDAREVEVADRGISMVFQNLALFPHMTGRENIIFPLVENGASDATTTKRLDFVSEVLHISHILHKSPAQMSGGERQRIALGRAFAAENKAMLLDEPIAALDARLREEMRVELKRLQRENNQTFVYVSHDEEEVMAISDRVAVMVDGKIVQIGTPDEVYSNPNSRAVAEVIGSPPMNFIVGQISKNGLKFTSSLLNGSTSISAADHSGETATLGIRPEDFWITVKQVPGAIGLLVSSIEPLGGYTIVNALLNDQVIKIRVAGQIAFLPGQNIYATIDHRRIHLFDSLGQRI
jgi:multiple sugar transport system ATP-binding protein